ncbi:amino acid deaminase [Pseudoalteromonas haloplanktis]|uniref:Amino acid deaminase n=1 Tax=Pseudoalteromonas haloplanktis TaxID=228 RepID=A0ABU1BA43_PSEHA|nr:amino acid deaminase [Pseudoalteromonas haloplanktis]MDQ9090374.1 amino acid deaminase [Pseudoalteromonas haloplanktis]
MEKLATKDAGTIASVNKGLGNSDALIHGDYNVALQHISLPCACIYQTRLDNNIAWMAEFAKQSQVEFSPHGKTTMAPGIFKKQLAAGAYAITIATVPQAVVAARAGAKRIIMANQLVGTANMLQLSYLLKQYEIDFYCLVDDVSNVTTLGEFFNEQGLQLKLLIELGVPGGRCGVVDSQKLQQLAAHIKSYSSLQLAGLEVYEGVLSTQHEVTAFLATAVAKCKDLIAQQAFATEQVIITAGGSAWYDLVCDAFAPANMLENMIPVIRPGCYVAHDQGIYEQAQQSVLARNPLACNIGSDLQSCLEIWAYVQSLPEPGRAIIGMGKRDVAFDAGLPIPNLHVDQSGTVKPAGAKWKVEKIMDQHAMLTYPITEQLEVGDIIAFATSHPCLTFDKWRYINVIDDNYNVIDIFDTYF